MLFSFFAKNLADIPWITPILAPDYALSSAALAILEAKGELKPSDKGESVLSHLFLRWFKDNGKNQFSAPLPDDVRVEKFAIGGGMTSGDGMTISETVLVTLESQSVIIAGDASCDISVLTKLSDQLKNTEAFRWSATLFLVSFFAEILFLVPKFREHKPKPDADEDYSGRSD